MESIRRKRKGRSHLSDGGDQGFQNRKKYRGVEKERFCGAGGVGAAAEIAMTAPPAGWLSCDTPLRGLKRKVGCIETATRIGRKKKLENEYILGLGLGKGKFGSVRQCRSRATGEFFACKTLMKAGEESVHREVEIMQHLSGYPGIVTLKAVFEDSDCFHLVMELCSEGRLLDQMKVEGRYSEQRAAQLLKELVSVIKYCHEMGVIHRDIKPENILLTASGKMKLADFGLAVRVTSGQRLCGVAGSPAYVAPEVLLGNYSKKVDVWGAGVLLHALLVGFLPFQGDTLESVFESIKKTELDLSRGAWESVSGLARDLIGQMLTRDVSARLTADQVLSHPWILFYTECSSKGTKPSVSDDSLAPEGIRAVVKRSLSWTHRSDDDGDVDGDDDDETGFVDAIAAAISRVKISEPKRSRLCGDPVSPIQQNCSSNLKTNLCPAF